MMKNPNEQSRLMRITSCLQAILDLEPELARLKVGESLLEEFVFLKSFLEKADRVSMSEADVERIERATSSFLEELRGTLFKAGATPQDRGRLQ